MGASCPPAPQSYRCHVILTEPRGSANQIRTFDRACELVLALDCLFSSIMRVFLHHLFLFSFFYLCSKVATKMNQCSSHNDHA